MSSGPLLLPLWADRQGTLSKLWSPSSFITLHSHGHQMLCILLNELQIQGSACLARISVYALLNAGAFNSSFMSKPDGFYEASRLFG